MLLPLQREHGFGWLHRMGLGLGRGGWLGLESCPVYRMGLGLGGWLGLESCPISGSAPAVVGARSATAQHGGPGELEARPVAQQY